MNNKILLIIILLLLLLTRKDSEGSATTSPLVTAYQDSEGNVFFAVSIGSSWYQLAASSEKINVGGYELESKPAPNGTFTLTVKNGGDVSTYFANSKGEII